MMNDPSALWAAALCVALWMRWKKPSDQITAMMMVITPSARNPAALPNMWWMLSAFVWIHTAAHESLFINFFPDILCSTIITGNLISQRTKATWPSLQVHSCGHHTDRKHILYIFHQLMLLLKKIASQFYIKHTDLNANSHARYSSWLHEGENDLCF